MIKYLLLIFLLSACNQKNPIGETDSAPKRTTQEVTASVDSTITEDSVEFVATLKDSPKIMTDGPRELRDVETEVKRHLISIKYWHHRSPSLANRQIRITVSFKINPLGVPSDIKLLETDLQDKTFIERVLKDMESWRFARTPYNEESTSVIFPIRLEPAQQLQL